MSIPSLLNPLTQQGFYELEFNPLYNPKVWVCERHEADPGNMPEAGKGVYVLMDTQGTEDGSFFVFVGQSGVTGEKATLCGNANSRINRLWYKDSPGMPDDIADWDKAILIFDWESDIEIRAEENGSAYNKDELMNDVMYNEVLHLEKLLRAEVNNSANLNLTSAGAGENYFMPNPDSERYKYYVAVAMETLRMIIEQIIK